MCWPERKAERNEDAEATATREGGRDQLTFASLTAGAPLLNGQRTVPGQHRALLPLTSHLFVLDKKRKGTDIRDQLHSESKAAAAVSSSYLTFSLARKL